jgi:Domain of unknown function (DUF4184)
VPVTPFHLIAATPIKAIVPRQFSWSVFTLTNIVIDLEPISVFLVTLEPRHLFFHTIIGATLVAALCATIGVGWCESAIKIWNEEIRGKPEEKWFKSNETISKFSAWFSALIGAWTHLLLDSFMHYDIRPLSPFTDANVLLGVISIGWLYSICLTLGLIGFVLLLIRRLKNRSNFYR